MRQDCKACLGYRNKGGYGVMKYQGKPVFAHRLVYSLANGLELQDIEGWVVRHDCDNPACVNPEHLTIGTVQDNVKDRMDRGRQHDCSGALNSNAKLTAEQRKEILERFVPRCRINGQGALSREFGVNQSQISRLIKQGY